jgi:hypothetical protein
MIKQYIQLIMSLTIGIILGASSIFLFYQHQNFAVNASNDVLDTPQEVKNFTFSNYDVYIDEHITKIIGEIKNNSSKKRTVKFTIDLIDDNGDALGTSSEVSIDIDAGASKSFLAMINKPIVDYTDVTFDVTSE